MAGAGFHAVSKIHWQYSIPRGSDISSNPLLLTRYYRWETVTSLSSGHDTAALAVKISRCIMNQMYGVWIMVRYECPACCFFDSTDLQSISHHIKNSSSAGMVLPCIQGAFHCSMYTEQRNPRSSTIYRRMFTLTAEDLSACLCLMQAGTLGCSQ